VTTRPRPLATEYTLEQWRTAAARSLTEPEKCLLEGGGGETILISQIARTWHPARISRSPRVNGSWTTTPAAGWSSSIPGFTPMNYEVQMVPGFANHVQGLQCDDQPLFMAVAGTMHLRVDRGEADGRIVRTLSPLELRITSAAIEQRNATIRAQERWLASIAQADQPERGRSLRALRHEGGNLIEGIRGHSGQQLTARVEFNLVAGLAPYNFDLVNGQLVAVGPEPFDPTHGVDRAIYELCLIVLADVPMPEWYD
jgi:hypothetical protein